MIICLQLLSSIKCSLALITAAIYATFIVSERRDTERILGYVQKMEERKVLKTFLSATYTYAYGASKIIHRFSFKSFTRNKPKHKQTFPPPFANHCLGQGMGNAFVSFILFCLHNLKSFNVIFFFSTFFWDFKTFNARKVRTVSTATLPLSMQQFIPNEGANLNQVSENDASFCLEVFTCFKTSLFFI